MPTAQEAVVMFGPPPPFTPGMIYDYMRTWKDKVLTLLVFCVLALVFGAGLAAFGSLVAGRPGAYTCVVISAILTCVAWYKTSEYELHWLTSVMVMIATLGALGVALV